MPEEVLVRNGYSRSKATIFIFSVLFLLVILMSQTRRLIYEQLERRDVMASIVGTSLGETLTGTPQGDSLFGLGGDDVLYGLGGKDVLRGGDGNDLLFGGLGNDVLYGDAGANTFIFGREPGARDTIKDFDPIGGDRISFSEIGVDVYYDVLMGANGAEIILANNQRIVIEGFDAALLNTNYVKFGQRGLQWVDWSPLTGEKYRYAPSGIQVGDSRYIFHCGNLVSGNVTDYIMMRKESLINGNWVFNSESVALSPGAAGSWDGRHTCDPSITRGNFGYAGTTYQYAMFYTGFDHDGGGINQIGLALANSVEGPWVKVTVNQPLINVPPGETNAWGAGQPSATSVDGGTVMLVYTRTRPGQIPFTYRQVLDLSVADAPVVIHPEMALTRAGLTQLDGTFDPSNHGGEVAYDPERDRFWIIRSMHPFAEDNPNFIAPALQIASIPAAHVWGGGGTWEVLEELRADEMGTDRVFDGGFLRNEWGQLYDTAVVQAMPSVALSLATTGNPVSEWTYRTHLVDIHLDVGPADFNRNGITSGDDLGHWKDGHGLSSGAKKSDGDADGDGDVDGRDFLIWQRNHEPIGSGSSYQGTAQSQLVSQSNSNSNEENQTSQATWWLSEPQEEVVRSSDVVLTQRMMEEYGKDEFYPFLFPQEGHVLDLIQQDVAHDRSLGDFDFEHGQTTPFELDHVFELIGSDSSVPTLLE